MNASASRQPPSAEADPRQAGLWRLRGRWTLANANAIGELLRDAPEHLSGIDARAVERLDTLGVLQLMHT